MIILTALRSTGQVCCGVFLNLDLPDGFLMISLGLWTLGNNNIVLSSDLLEFVSFFFFLNDDVDSSEKYWAGMLWSISQFGFT